ncbi:uncharacterized protein LOC129798395 [Phlebotomus papatasi]|uniref:uncharacterized protein LOC129798395 n=1 Tax=Phlebotomus papatasi TaxID=29031 RepID=UPI002484294F|nr:uncharacterized protein LOC129798395 [Phlebotomus papatasi]
MASLVNISQSTHEQVVHLMSNLAERVINDPPGDIYLFAQKFFEELLLKRDGWQSKNYEKLPNCAKLIKNSSKRMQFKKIDIIKTKIDYLRYYRKQSQEKKHKNSNQDNKGLIQSQKNIVDVEKGKENIKFEILFNSHLKQYKCVQSSFENFSEDDEGLEIQENIYKKLITKENRDFQPLSRKSNKFFVVNHLIKIYMPRIYFSSSDILLKVKSFDKVNLIAGHNIIKNHSVKVTFLASNDYGVVFTVNCGLDSEVMIFLLRMPNEAKMRAQRMRRFHKAIDFKANILKYKMNLYIFERFLLKCQEYLNYGLLDCKDIIILNNPEGCWESFEKNVPLDYQKNSEVCESEISEDQINISTEDYTPQKTLDVFRIGNDLGYFKTHKIIRSKSAPKVLVPKPKHMRQRMKSAK